MTQPIDVSIAYTPDSDDAFYYYALQTEKIPSGRFRFSFHTDHIIALNRAAREGRYHVTAVSSVAYPELAERYRILSVGTSVGRGYGPVLVSRQKATLDDLKHCRIGVAGVPTTGGLLLKWALPEAELVEMQFDRIADAVAAGELAAGVMIHEELLFYPRKGLHKVVDLGALWCQRTERPLPVGLNLVRRDLGTAAASEVCDLIRQSLSYALEHPEEAMQWACRFGRGEEAGCGAQHISMFANLDSLLMPADVREALEHMMRVVCQVGIAERVPPIDIIDGSADVAHAAARRLAA